MVAAALVLAACTSTKAHSRAPTTSTAPSTTSDPAARGPVATSPGSAADLPLPPVAPVVWKACDGVDGPSGYDCATVQVPLDYANPGGRKIGIALDRKPAAGTKVASLLMNPGGPGASGVDELDYLQSLLGQSVLDHFDIVSFDPRGVGRSAAVRCETGAQLDQFIHLNPSPATDAGFRQLVAATRSFAQACQARSAALLPFVGTVNAARDLDELRAALGDAKLTYIGFSYGTFLGATYADLFPTHIRSMVLDGAVDPAQDPIQSNLEQGAGFDKELNAFFAYCTNNFLCPWQPNGSLKADFDALMARIATRPLPGAGSRTVGPGEAFFGVAQELYDQGAWPDLATAPGSGRCRRRVAPAAVFRFVHPAQAEWRLFQFPGGQ